MTKNWRHRGFTLDGNNHDQLIRTSINQGKMCIKISEKLKKNEKLSDLEREFTQTILEGLAKDFINNAVEKAHSLNSVGRQANPYRYEICLFYYSALKVLKVKSQASLVTAHEYLFTIEGDDTQEEKIHKLRGVIEKWINNEDKDNYLKSLADSFTITNPEEILKRYNTYKNQ